MHDEVNRLLGLEGFTVNAVEERGGALEVEVELTVTAAVSRTAAEPAAR